MRNAQTLELGVGANYRSGLRLDHGDGNNFEGNFEEFPMGECRPGGRRLALQARVNKSEERPVILSAVLADVCLGIEFPAQRVA